MWEIALKPSAGLEDATAIGTSPRVWLEALLDKIHDHVGERRTEEVYPALQAIYECCKKLPEGSAKRRTLERLVVAIWKRGEEKIDEEDVWKLDAETLGLISDLGKRAGRSWRL